MGMGGEILLRGILNKIWPAKRAQRNGKQAVLIQQNKKKIGKCVVEIILEYPYYVSLALQKALGYRNCIEANLCRKCSKNTAINIKNAFDQTDREVIWEILELTL